MAKIITKAVTRLQKFLAAIAGDAVAPTPITNQEKLLFNIAEEMKAASASDLPDIGSSDKNKFLHTNDSTGAVEWADAPDGLPAVTDVDEGKVLTVNNSGVWVAQTPASGGGALVVTVTTSGGTKTMDKTWQEIADADVVNVKDGEYRAIVNKVTVNDHMVYLGAAPAGMTATYTAPSADGYPASTTK